MIGGIGLAESRKLAAGFPVETAGIYDYAAHDRTVAADKLGGGMHHDIRAVFDGAQQPGRGKGVVHDERYAVAVRNGRDRLKIHQIRVRIAQRFHIEQFGVVPDRPLEIFGIVRRDERCFKALFRERMGKKIVGSAVEVGGGNDVIASPRDILHRIGNGRAARGGGQSRRAAFQRRDAFFEDVGGGVHQPCIDIATYCQPKTSGCRSGIGKNIGCRGVDGHRARIGRAVGLLLPNV